MSNQLSPPTIKIVSRQTGKTFGLLRNGVLEKYIKESPHLLWREGGVPCLDAEMWDKYHPSINTILVYTEKERIFKVDAEKFDECRQELNLGYGRQYYIAKEHWEIINIKQKI